jgi:hypothetical protein
MKKKKLGVDIKPTSKQLSIGQKRSYINNRKNYPYVVDESQEYGHAVASEREYNLIKVFRFLNRKYEYEHQVFILNNDEVVIPKLFDLKRKIFYLFKDEKSTKALQIKMVKLQQEQNIKIHFINRKKYIRILSFFYKKIKFNLTECFSFNEQTIIKHILSTNRKCLICGNELNINEKKYCSKKCWYESKKKVTTSICLNCNNEFSLSVVEKNKNYKLFCSETCQQEYEEKMNNGLVSNKYHTMPYQEFECKQCNKKFKTFARNAKYCSVNCENKAKKERNKKEYVCMECGNRFISHQRNPKFCSTSCSSKYNARVTGFGTINRPKNPVWNKGLDKSDSRIQKGVIKQKKTFAKHMSEGKIKMYFQGKHLTKAHKLHCSIAQSKALRNGKRTFGNTRMHGLDIKMLGYKVRSHWELNFALMLEYVNKEYKYEPTTFTLSDGRTYTPDFYTTKNNTYYEIKGFWFKGSKEKFELFKCEFPNVKIKLIEKKQYVRLLNFFVGKIDKLYLTDYQRNRINNGKKIRQ